MCGRGSQTSFNSLKQRNKKGGGKASLGLPSFNVFLRKVLKKPKQPSILTVILTLKHRKTESQKIDSLSQERTPPYPYTM